MVKKIAVLTSGGDAPGMNGAVRAVVRGAFSMGIVPVCVNNGYSGLINGDFLETDLRTVSDVIHRGGTFLHTARCPEFRTEEGMQKAIDTCRKNGIEGVVVVGGDGSFRGAQDLSRRGLPCVGVPGTIDNDIACSDYTIGFDTAMNTCLELIDRLRDTSQSHNRCNVVEVMGRHAGHIALNVGIAVGATGILVPEVPYDLQEDVLNRIARTQATGKKHFIFVVAEGVGHVNSLAKEIEELTGIETRATILGHVQRGGRPTLRDRVMGSELGYAAIKLLAEGKSNRVVASKNGAIVDYDIEEALAMTKGLDMEKYNMAMNISM